MNSSAKKLNEMNRLGDMGHFPAVVNAGATVNVLATICVTWFVEPRYPQAFAPVVWVAVVLALNLLPVVLLRLRMGPGTEFPTLAEMDFVRDQHKFSDWVYVAASANMAFWVLVSWAVFSLAHAGAALAGMLVVAFVATFSPVLLRGAGGGVGCGRGLPPLDFHREHKNQRDSLWKACKDLQTKTLWVYVRF
jgi:hypothetical protein